MIGLTDREMEKALETLDAAVYKAITPAVVPEVFNLTLDEKHLIIVEVAR